MPKTRTSAGYTLRTTSSTPWSTLLSRSGVKWGEPPANPQTREIVFILGNAYGHMPYQEPLAAILAQHDFTSVWTCLPGQEGSTGTFSLPHVTEFLRDLITNGTPEDSRVAFICHCASTIGLLKVLTPHLQPSPRCLVAYGPLLNLSRLSTRALPRLREAGVEFQLPPEVWNLPIYDLFAGSPVPIMIAHSRDSANRRRASMRQVKRLAGSASIEELYVAERGYDDDLDSLPAFAERYVPFIRSHFSQA